MSGIMKVRCDYWGCKNNSFNSPNKSFFRISADSEKCRRWLICMGRLDLLANPPWKLHQYVRVCAEHFEDKSFSIPGTRLHPNAVPKRRNAHQVTANYIKQEHCYGSLLEEISESQEQLSEDNAEEQGWCDNTLASASNQLQTLPRGNRTNETPQKTAGHETLSGIVTNSHTQEDVDFSVSTGNFDAVDHLFLSWAKTVKTFSPHQLLETKREIADLILRQEEAQMVEDLLSSCNS